MKTKAVEINEHIVADQEICHGQPTFKGTRIMVWQVLELLGTGVNAEEILRDYFPQLSKEAISAAISYASQLIQEERHVTFSKAKASV
ncbi:DUF433 domain-containing protein [Candidatus Woesearchaeota archaeon]|nr:DUF433 domain-containing protein [Candidatus Woesearchaeota archaeon]